jgi:hypothetical protein
MVTLGGIQERDEDIGLARARLPGGRFWPDSAVEREAGRRWSDFKQGERPRSPTVPHLAVAAASARSRRHHRPRVGDKRRKARFS